MTVIGIDPGSRVCGYGVVCSKSNSLKLIESGVILLDKKNPDFNLRLLEIHNRLTEVIKRTRPDAASFESLFYAKNVQSLVKLSHARAVALLVAVQNSLEVSEYSPREIKKSVSGNGNAGKEQVQFMVKTLLNMTEQVKHYDVTDALATAICHILRAGVKTSGARTWEDFIRQNPDRISK